VYKGHFSLIQKINLIFIKAYHKINNKSIDAQFPYKVYITLNMNLHITIQKIVSFFKYFGLLNLTLQSDEENEYPKYKIQNCSKFYSIFVIICVLTNGSTQIFLTNSSRHNIALDIGFYFVCTLHTFGLSLAVTRNIFKQIEICKLFNKFQKTSYKIFQVSKNDFKISFKSYVLPISVYTSCLILYDVLLDFRWRFFFDYMIIGLQYLLGGQFGALALVLASMYENLQMGITAAFREPKYSFCGEKLPLQKSKNDFMNQIVQPYQK